jgi:hypothetical protein
MRPSPHFGTARAPDDRVVRLSLRLLLAIVVALLSTACTGALRGGDFRINRRPVEQHIYTFGVVACADETNPCRRPIPGALIKVHSTAGYIEKTANRDGYALFGLAIAFSDIHITADGFDEAALDIEPAKIEKTNIVVALKKAHGEDFP